MLNGFLNFSSVVILSPSAGILSEDAMSLRLTTLHENGVGALLAAPEDVGRRRIGASRQQRPDGEYRNPSIFNTVSDYFQGSKKSS